MSLLQPSGLERSAGLLFPRGKSRQKRAGETPAPLFVQSDASKGDSQLPLDFCLAAGPS